jgi:hypothetical protein
MSSSNYIKRLLNPKERQQVWNANIKGDCALCPLCVYYGFPSAVLYRTRFTVGHIVAEVHGGQRSTRNIRPICQSCNSRQSTTSLPNGLYIYRHPKTSIDVTRTNSRLVIFQEDDPDDSDADEAIEYNSCDESENEYDKDDLAPETSRDDMDEDDPDDDDDEKDDDEYEVDEILDERRINGCIEFLVKWKNYQTGDSTWEVCENLRNSPDALISWIQIKHQREQQRNQLREQQRNQLREQQRNQLREQQRNQKTVPIQSQGLMMTSLSWISYQLFGWNHNNQE